MKSRWWDPGIRNGDRIGKACDGKAHQGGDTIGSWANRIKIMEIRRKEIYRIFKQMILSVGWRLLSIIIIKQSTDNQGNNFLISTFTKLGNMRCRYGNLEILENLVRFL